MPPPDILISSILKHNTDRQDTAFHHDLTQLRQEAIIQPKSKPSDGFLLTNELLMPRKYQYWIQEVP